MAEDPVLANAKREDLAIRGEEGGVEVTAGRRAHTQCPEAGEARGGEEVAVATVAQLTKSARAKDHDRGARTRASREGRLAPTPRGSITTRRGARVVPLALGLLSSAGSQQLLPWRFGASE